MIKKLAPALFAAVILAGCSLQQQREPAPQVVTPPPQAKPVSKPVPPPPPKVAILVSRDIPPYTEVSDRIKVALKGRASVHTLSDKGEERLMRQVEGESATQLVTIGLEASLLGRRIDGRQQVFCQVFNYTGYDLTGENSKGVSMLPGLKRTFVAWKRLSPSITDVAIISGPGLDKVLERARDIAAGQGITLHHEVVNNDKEFLYRYKQLAARVQGYWLLPDNRVLSVRTLKDVMTFSVRGGKQVVVFSDELLQLGGLFSVSSDYQDIADKVISRLEQAAHKPEIPGPELMLLDRARMKINAVMVQRLGLNLPDDYREYAGESRSP